MFPSYTHQRLIVLHVDQSEHNTVRPRFRFAFQFSHVVRLLYHYLILYTLGEVVLYVLFQDLSQLWVSIIVHKHLPRGFPDVVNLDLFFHFVNERVLRVEGALVSADDVAFLQPDHVLGLSVYLKAYFYRTFHYKLDLVYVLHHFVDDFALGFSFWLKQPDCVHQEVSVNLIVPTKENLFIFWEPKEVSLRLKIWEKLKV